MPTRSPAQRALDGERCVFVRRGSFPAQAGAKSLQSGAIKAATTSKPAESSKSQIIEFSKRRQAKGALTATPWGIGERQRRRS